MTVDVGKAKQKFLAMVIGDTILLVIAVLFAVARFVYGVDWAIWGFIGFLLAGFGLQLWFISGLSRLTKGD